VNVEDLVEIGARGFNFRKVEIVDDDRQGKFPEVIAIEFQLLKG
jgi:hypothetical protein